LVVPPEPPEVIGASGWPEPPLDVTPPEPDAPPELFVPPAPPEDEVPPEPPAPPVVLPPLLPPALPLRPLGPAQASGKSAIARVPAKPMATQELGILIVEVPLVLSVLFFAA
jgi:hypothetical protein